MTDPVIDPEGNTYEREAIEKWLSDNNTSPVTRNPLTVQQLVPNRTLKRMIDEELKKLDLSAKLSPEEEKKEISSKSKSNSTQTQRQTSSTSTSDSLSLSLTIAPKEENDSTMMISIHPPTNHLHQRSPLDLVCVVDVSGSMGEPASIKGMEDSGLSLLDIVKHALKTIVVMLSDEDRIALVTYSNDARVVFSLTVLNRAGRARVNSLIEGLTAGGMTNLWDGLSKGLDVLWTDTLRTQATTNEMLSRNSAIFLLTDGIPNVEPPRGHLPRLKRYKDSHGGVYPGTISTFGFGKF